MVIEPLARGYRNPRCEHLARAYPRCDCPMDQRGVNIDFSLAAEPTRWEETLPEVCSESEKWKEAMDDEIVSMTKFGVYKALPRSAAGNRQILGARWVYKRKVNKFGEVYRYRARLVAQGFRQKAYDSYDPDQTFSPVVHKDSLRMFLSVCAAENLRVYQADVKAAFLQAPLDEKIFVRAPPGYDSVDPVTGEPMVWKLSKSIYALKQSSACFWTAMDEHLRANGFKSVLDIALAVGVLARHGMTPGKAHVRAAKRVVMYLYNARKLGITYRRPDGSGRRHVPVIYEGAKHPLDNGLNRLQTFADSDYAGDETRKSTYGTVILMNGGPIAWNSTMGKTIAMSTCEAEIHAAVVAVKDAIHIKKMLQDLELYPDDRPLEIAEDNSAAIAQANSGIKYIRNAKHYEIRLRFLQQKVVEKDVEFKYCPAEHQIADFFTKPLDAAKFIWFRKSLMS